MFDNLKIAVRKQKKLIIIFLLTIFLPAISLSIFGVMAIRNEKFRLARQMENQHRRIADFLKTQIHSSIKDIEIFLKNLAQYPSFSGKDFPTIKELIDNQLLNNRLVEQVFIVYEDEELFSPIFQIVSERRLPLAPSFLKSSQREKLRRAEEYEFKQKDYKSSISLYRELFSLSRNRNNRAQMLNTIARNFMNLKSYHKAIKNYLIISNNYPESITSSRLPLAVIARLQIIDCYNKLGDSQDSLKNALHLYNDILRNPWNLSEDQFKTYSSMVAEIISKVLSQNASSFSGEEYKDEFEQLKHRHLEKIEQWKVYNEIKREIIPKLRARLMQPESNTLIPWHQSKKINDKNFLILAVTIPDKTGKNSKGILGIKMNNDYLVDVVLNKIIADIQFSENTNIAIFDLSGRKLYGEKTSPAAIPTISEYFEDNFPPWKIELSRAERLGVIEIHKSFYFWTILTLIMILTFGSVLIVRTIAHEMEVLKIKSDFVSSVSHELKTPLTSIKALTERLQEGKVKSQAKMKQYFSVISQDTDKLTRLVRNVLDFSKIEEGKKEYDLEETDVVSWINQTIENFKQDHIQTGIRIHTQISEGTPVLDMDKDAFSRALNNLLDNALKFSPNKKEVEVHVKSDAENVIIQVKDRGIGIPQDELGKIFDKFYQGRSALKQSVKGTGLGLTLVKHVVEAHGGKISVESKMSQGTTCSLIFPLKRT